MKTYLGTFLIAFATLALEVSLTRLLSVVTWYHLAFFAISTAMLGMTAGAVAVYVQAKPETLQELERRLQDGCVGFGLTVPMTLVVLTQVRLTTHSPWDMVVGLLVFTVACSLPFFFAGTALALVLTRHPLPVSRVYGSDLVGAALGCLFVLGALEFLDVPSLILVIAGVGVAGGLFYGAGSVTGRARGLAWSVTGVLMLAAMLSVAGWVRLEPTTMKGRWADPANEIVDRWNSFSRVIVYRGSERAPFYWGASPRAPQPDLWQHYMHIDGEAGTTLVDFTQEGSGSYLLYDITSFAYLLRPSGGAVVIGVGGGRDVQAALVAGHERVTGIEVNPIFIDLLNDEFRELASLADRAEVNLVADEARSYLSRVEDRYRVIQMSMIDTWAATGAGAFSHTEGGLYTVEAWSTFLRRLTEDGIFTVSRWHSPSELGETARVMSLAVATLQDLGVEHPADHLALITTTKLSTLLVGRRPFTDADRQRLRDEAQRLGFEATVLPGVLPEHPLLRDVLSSRTREELLAVAEAAPLDITPPTDESPYFFNMLRLRQVPAWGPALFSAWEDLPAGVLRGNLLATGVLVGLVLTLLVLTVVTVLVPLMIRAPVAGADIHWWGAVYFCLIGAGFMSVEIGLIQRLSVFLGHPVYALGILLFTIILSTGLGSYLTEFLPLTTSRGRWTFPLVTAVAVVLVAQTFPILGVGMEAAGRLPRIAASVGLIMPLGILLGLFFPTGMSLLEEHAAAETPWYWALNGVFGLLFASTAVFVAIHFGISMNLFIGAACYLGTAVALRKMVAP